MQLSTVSSNSGHNLKGGYFCFLTLGITVKNRPSLSRICWTCARPSIISRIFTPRCTARATACSVITQWTWNFDLAWCFLLCDSHPFSEGIQIFFPVVRFIYCNTKYYLRRKVTTPRDKRQSKSGIKKQINDA